jgi:hypothetical protein
MVTTRAQIYPDLDTNNMVENAEEPNAHAKADAPANHMPPQVSTEIHLTSFSSVMGSEDELEHRPIRSRKLPKLSLLRCPLQLKTHLRVIETMFREEGVLIDSMRAKTAIIDSLYTCDQIHSNALSMIDLPWFSIRDTLLATFSDPNYVRLSIEAKVSNLKFNEDQMLLFVQEARSLYTLVTPDMDRRWFCDRVFSLLPRPILRDLIDRARTRDSCADWRSHEFHWLLSELSDIINSAVALNQLKPLRAPRAPVPILSDRVRHVSNSSPRSKPGSAWLSDWVKQFKSVYVVNGPTTAAVASVLNAADEHKKLRRKHDGSEYYFVAFKQGDGSHAMRTLPTSTYKIFEHRRSKNLEGAE